MFIPAIFYSKFCNVLYRLAEGRSNPNLLDIGGLDPATVSGEVKHYMLLGDRSMENLAHSKSHDNLFL